MADSCSRPRAAISWSGGKDSCSALARVDGQYDVVAAITMFDEARGRSRSHGLRPEVLAAQARRLGLRQVTAGCTWDTYNAAFTTALHDVRDMDVTHVVFGDIMFDDHRRWAERICAESGMTAWRAVESIPAANTASTTRSSRARRSSTDRSTSAQGAGPSLRLLGARCRD